MSQSITREDVLKLAKMSQLIVTEDELLYYTRQLEARLSYTTGLKTIIEKHPELKASVEPQQMNIMRDDIASPTNVEPLLAQAPQREENFFVVPVVVKQNK